MRNILAATALAVLALAGLAVAGVRPALGGGGSDHRVTICHHVEGNGNTGNGFNIETVDKDSIVNVDGVLNGHGLHDLDIIPAFAAGSDGPHEWGSFPGRGDASLIGQNCGGGGTTSTTTTTTGTTTTTTTETTTETTTTQPTTTETTTTTETQPPGCTVNCNPCPPGQHQGGKDGEPGNDSACVPDNPPNDSTTITTTTEPPTTTTEPPVTTTTEPTTTSTTPSSPPPTKPKPKPSPPKHHAKPPPGAPPNAPPPCPPGKTYNGKCGVQGSG